MSMGYGGFARKVDEDSESVIYAYGGYNLNMPAFKNAAHIYDGILTISKHCFIEPEIHQRVRRMPSGKKKLVTKRIPREVDINAGLQSGKISIENCSNAWHLLNCSDNLKIDLTAMRLLFIMFEEYQKIGKIPEDISFHC